MDGPVELKVPSGTQPGTTLLMAKRGVPRLGNASVRGDHQVRLAAMTGSVRVAALVQVTVRHIWSLIGALG